MYKPANAFRDIVLVWSQYYACSESICTVALPATSKTIQIFPVPPFSPAALHVSLPLLVEGHLLGPSQKKERWEVMVIRRKYTENKSDGQSTWSLHIYLEVPDEWRNAAVRLIVIFLMRQFL